MVRKSLPNGRSANRRFIRLHAGITGSDAYQDLKPLPRALLIEIWRRHDGFNNGRIPYSEREGASALHTGRNQIRAGLNDLIEHGFIVRHQRGSFNVKDRTSSEYSITAEDMFDGTPATHAYREWRKQETGSKTIPNGVRSETREKSIGSGAILNGLRSDT